MIRLDWDDLRLFLAIARAGTLTAAAEALKLSQPTAGRRLRGLEEACGCALFQRTPFGLKPTDEGELMLRHAARIEAETLAISREFLGAEDGLHGQLRLSSSDWFAARILGPAAAQFTLQHPGVSFEIIGDHRLLSLERREADLAFRFQAFDGPDLIRRHFVHIRYALYASPAYLAKKGPVDWNAPGDRHGLITMDSQFDHLADVVWLRKLMPDSPIVLRSNGRETQASACAAGAGLAVLPRCIGDALGLTVLRPPAGPPGRDVWLGYHHDLKRLKRLRLFIDHLVNTVPDPI
jgi:DNA-binding transcriptional LysR family regulator